MLGSFDRSVHNAYSQIVSTQLSNLICSQSCNIFGKNTEEVKCSLASLKGVRSKRVKFRNMVEFGGLRKGVLKNMKNRIKMKE